MKCGVLTIAIERHFKADNMRDLFENINMDDVLPFLREAELYLKIYYLITIRNIQWINLLINQILKSFVK